MTAPPIPTNPRPGPVAEAVAKSQASEPRQATFDEVYKQEAKASTTPGPRFTVEDKNYAYVLVDRLDHGKHLLAIGQVNDRQVRDLNRIAALLNNHVPDPPRVRPVDAPCSCCGFIPSEHTSDCPRHAWVANGGLGAKGEGVAR